MNRKKIFLSLFLVSVMSLSQVYADFDYADSPEFQLDLLTFPLGGAYDYSDSLQFGLDLYPVNRDWADSNSFLIDFLRIIGDINRDDKVDGEDLFILIQQWLQEPGEPSADIAPAQVDNFVDLRDFAAFAENWLEGVFP